MRDSWKNISFPDAVFIQEGPGIRKYEYEEDGFPMINVRCVQDGFVDMQKSKSANRELANGKWKHFQIDEGDILYTISGTIGRSAIVKKEDLPLLMNTSVVRFKTKLSSLDQRFLYHYVRSHEFIKTLKNMSTGTAIKNVGPSHIKKLSIPIPPIEEQKEIVSILDEAFASIDIAKANIERNIENAKELFQSKLNEIFSQTGEGWASDVLKEATIFKSGRTVSKDIEKDDGDILYTKVSDMNLEGNEKFITTSTRYVDINDINENQIIPVGSIIFPKRGGAIATNKKRKIIKPTIVDLNTMAVAPLEKINTDYLYFWFESIDLKELSNGTSIPQINNNSFDNVYITYPKSLFEQKEIAEILDKLNNLIQSSISNYEKELDSLEELKKSILQKAFRAELTNKSVAA